MTAIEFNAECEERLIAPGVALENEKLRRALGGRDDERVIEILDTEF